VFIGQEALDVYINLFKILKDHGVEPMVTLHHFSEPSWFHDLGSFEKEQNILCFLNFASFVFPSLTQTYKNAPLVNGSVQSTNLQSKHFQGIYVELILQDLNLIFKELQAF
jgi:beta-glucosidase/6-phospho-beta-glucosidase/beta-galactosidase